MSLTKFPLVCCLLIALLSTVSAQVSQWTPPVITSVETFSPAGGSAGTTLIYRVRVQPGTVPDPSVILNYNGPESLQLSAFWTEGGDIAVSIPISETSIVGTYTLDRITLGGGAFTVYRRAGEIDRVFYPESAPTDLPATHELNLAAGDFFIVGSGDPVPQNPATIETGRAVNLSTRGIVTGSDVMVSGLVVSNGSKSFLFRAVGPGLQPHGVPNFLADPTVELKNAQGETILANAQWSSDLAATAASVGAFALPEGSRDAMLRATLPAGLYTLVVSSGDGSDGVVLLEVYELP